MYGREKRSVNERRGHNKLALYHNLLHNLNAGWVPRQSSTGLVSLDASQTPQLVLVDLDGVLTEADLAGGALQEANTVRVQALVDGSRARLSAGEWDAGLRLFELLPVLALAEVLDDGSLHRELDQVEREEPDDVPDPDDTNPTARNSVNLREAPVGKSSNDRGDELRNAESTQESRRGALHEEESVRTSDEDEGLRDDGNLEVDNRVELIIVRVLLGTVFAVETHAKLVLEEVSLQDDDDEDDGGKGEVETVSDSVRENLSKIP